MNLINRSTILKALRWHGILNPHVNMCFRRKKATYRDKIEITDWWINYEIVKKWPYRKSSSCFRNIGSQSHRCQREYPFSDHHIWNKRITRWKFFKLQMVIKLINIQRLRWKIITRPIWPEIWLSLHWFALFPPYCRISRDPHLSEFFRKRAISSPWFYGEWRIRKRRLYRSKLLL